MALMDILRESTEENKLSLGRTTFVYTLILASYYWLILKTDVPDTLYNFLIALTIYNFGKKLRPYVGTLLERRSP